MPSDSGKVQEQEQRIEEVVELRNNLAVVQEDLVDEFFQDRKEMIELKSQVKDIKRELKDEMKNIKQVMTALFETQQQAMIS